MSTTKLFRAGLIASVGIAGLTLTAQAQSRYGSVYDYESGRNCGQACTPAAPVSAAPTRYGAPVYQAAPVYQPAPVYNPAPVYVPQPATVYTAPTQTYSAPVETYSAPVQSYTSTAQLEAVSCPAGTTAQADGTCLQGSSSSYSSESSYSTGTSTSYSSPSYSSQSYSSSAEPVSCPAGTTAQSDGTCLQGSSSSSFSTGSTYSSGSTDYSSSTSYPSSDSSYSSFGGSSSLGSVSCPAGTTAQSDGTCLQGSGSNSFAGSSVEIYTGDAISSTSSSQSYGYSNDTSSYGSDYLPIRK